MPIFLKKTNSITYRSCEGRKTALEKKNETWNVTDKPKGKIPFGYKWIFTIKYKANRAIKQYKTRLVSKGFTQTYDIDYKKTFAHVAKLNTVRVLSLEANLDLSLQQLGIKNVFLK